MAKHIDFRVILPTFRIIIRTITGGFFFGGGGLANKCTLLIVFQNFKKRMMYFRMGQSIYRRTRGV